MDQKIHVLVIDDDRSVGKFLKKKLEKTQRYIVSYAENKEMGMGLSRTEKPDILILDIDLEMESGGDIAKELEDDPELKNVPFLFFSSLISPKEVAQREGKLGGHTIVSKGSKIDELISNIEAVLAESH